jgi:predicted Fe-Mo cluster-binding NifX family protein
MSMKIGVAATGGSLDAEVANQFGRCRWFVVVDSETRGFEAFLNSASTVGGGAGPAAVKELVDRGVQVALAGKFGPNALQAIEAAGLRYAEASGKVRSAVANLVNGSG